MTRFIFLAIAATLFTSFASGEASAQKKGKAAAACAPGFVEQCIKNCSNRGGQPRYCPTYCNDQQRKAGCS